MRFSTKTIQRNRKPVLHAKIGCADFETVVLEDTANQTETEVWSAAYVDLWDKTENVHVFNNFEDWLEWIKRRGYGYNRIYFHNVKFDGSFIIDWALRHGFKNGINYYTNTFLNKFDLAANQMCYSISNKGQWYEICLQFGNCLIEFRDSLKLLPFSLRKMCKDFGTKHQKLEMEYKGDRHAGGEIKKDEMPYIKNDVLGLKECLEFMLDNGHDSLTIGACCLKEFKAMIGNQWDRLFPNLRDMIIDKSVYGSSNVDEYVRHSYRGGWCYQVKGKEGRHYNGHTADVNSLFPSMMHSSSGNYYPIGCPTFFRDAIPEEATKNNRYYFVRIQCRFKIKPDKLPWMQIKGNMFYTPTECLTDSDFNIFHNGQWTKVPSLKKDGEIIEAKPIITLTMSDYQLLLEHYDVTDLEILDGCYFESAIGLFDEYIDKYAQIKKTSKGALRVLAKLFLNNLYGKLATSPDSSYKVCSLKNDVVVLNTVNNYDKETVYIAAGSAITSYARCFTIRAAQVNYHGVDKPGFIYADTDSIHCDLPLEEIKGIKIDDNEFNCWKIESTWDVGYFVRQKTYIEHVIEEDLKPIDNPYYNIKCAGLPDKCKEAFNAKLESGEAKLEDFNVGLKLDGKLMPKRIKGGIVLVDTTYVMH